MRATRAVAGAAEVVGDGGGEVRAARDAAEEEVPDDQELPVGRLKHRRPPCRRARGTPASAPTPDQRAPSPPTRSESTKTLRCGQQRLLREVVGRRLVEEQEERVEPAEEALAVGAVELGVLEAHPLERLHALLAPWRTSSSRNPNWMDSVGHALAQAGPSPLWMRSLQKVHLLARPVSWLKDTTPNGHEPHAVPAAVADVLVDVDGAELGPVDGAGRAGVEAAGLRAVLADVRHQEPRQLAVGLRLLDEAHEPERLVREVRAGSGSCPSTPAAPAAARSTACTPPGRPGSRCRATCP